MTTIRYTAACLRSAGSTFNTWIRQDERGEGVISAAIAVLVMAFLGVAMWGGLRIIWESAESNTAEQVELIGQ